MNSMLRKTLGHKREEVRECHKKLPNSELNGLYTSQKIIWVINEGDKMVRAYGTHEAEEECLQGLDGET
jgi:hypothetical protein